MKHNTIYSFVKACESKTADEIYALFEFDTEPAIRDAIMGMSHPNDPEPVRGALNILGCAYGVFELTDY